MFLYFHVSSFKCLFSFIFSYCFKKYKMSLLGLSKLIVSPFSFRTSFEEMFSFVSPILRGHFGGHYRSLLEYRYRPKCNSHFSGLGFLSPYFISFFNVLTNINCLLNCYLVKMTTDSLHYLSLLFEFLSYNKYLYSILFLDFSLLFLLVYFRFFLMIFLF